MHNSVDNHVYNAILCKKGAATQVAAPFLVVRCEDGFI